VPIPVQERSRRDDLVAMPLGAEFVAESLSPWTLIEYWFEAKNVCDVVLSAFTVMDTRHP
jgi:hypothetical protein